MICPSWNCDDISTQPITNRVGTREQLALGRIVTVMRSLAIHLPFRLKGTVHT